MTPANVVFVPTTLNVPVPVPAVGPMKIGRVGVMTRALPSVRKVALLMISAPGVVVLPSRLSLLPAVARTPSRMVVVPVYPFAASSTQVPGPDFTTDTAPPLELSPRPIPRVLSSVLEPESVKVRAPAPDPVENATFPAVKLNGAPGPPEASRVELALSWNRRLVVPGLVP